VATVVTETPSVEIAQLARDLRAIGGAVSRHLNREYKIAAGPIARDAASRASWSTRIPAAIKVRSSRSKVFPGADVVVGGLPHPRLYEGLTKGGGKSFRHKVFERPGRRTVWVSQSTRPFIRPAVRQGIGGFQKASDTAVMQAAKENGFT
jgi:hypothetical protein